MLKLEELLAASAAVHHHLCPRQVLGVRMAMLTGNLLGLDLPQTDKRLLTIVETDGCAVSGISVATGCRVGRRTLRVEDYGKVAATFVDTLTERAVRLAPQTNIRNLVAAYAPEADNRWVLLPKPGAGGKRICWAISECLLTNSLTGKRSCSRRRCRPFSASPAGASPVKFAARRS